MRNPNETSRYETTTRPRHFNLADDQRRKITDRIVNALESDEVPTLAMQRDTDADLADAQRQLNSIAAIAAIFGKVA